MNNQKKIKNLFQKDHIAPVEFSYHREIAALGAAWKGVMLKKGDKPNKEPTLSIGMILPTDLRKQLTITIPKEKKKISIEAKSEYLEYENSKKKEIILKGSHSEDFFIIHSVPAGRGFHWEKTIDVKVAGNLHIKIQMVIFSLSMK